MATEEKTPQTQGGAAASPTPEPQTQAKPPETPAASAATEKVEQPKPAKATPAASAASGEPAGPRRVAIKDDEDLPEDADLIELSPTALKKRLTRATNAHLRERFGTTDTDVIKKKLDRAEQLEAAEEKRRRDALDEKARLEEDIKKANDRATAAEAKLTAAQEERIVDHEEGRVKGIAEGHIKPKFWKYAARDFAEHLRGMSQADLDKMKDKDINKWFGNYVAENPEFGKAAAEAKPEIKKEAITNGAKNDERQTSKGAPNLAEKTFKPGQPNSMTPAEARAEAGRLGYRY